MITRRKPFVLMSMDNSASPKRWQKGLPRSGLCGATCRRVQDWHIAKAIALLEFLFESRRGVRLGVPTAAAEL